MESPFRAIAEYTYDWESWICPEGKLRWVNGAVERITGYSVEECLAMEDYPLAMVHELDRPALAAVLLQARLGHTGNHFEFRVKHKDGGTRWAAISWQPINVDGKDVGFRSSVRDIDERKRMEQELHAAMSRAEAANHAKTQFLASVTHELRTPLQSIIGYGQLLMGADLKDPLRSYADTMLQQSEHLEHLVSDLLDFSALQAGMLSVRSEPFEPREVIERVVRSLEPLATKRGLVLHGKTTASAPVLGDSHRFAQIVTNLVSNAIKYTPSGKVILTTSTSRKHGEFKLSVEDTGPGLPAGTEVFEPFRQGPHAEVNRGGVGLGLALSRHLCVRMGGSLEASTSKLGGAKLVVTLPLASAGEQLAIAHFDAHDGSGAVSPSFARQYPLNVLVVDDVEPAREFLVAALLALGYSAFAAACADDAFKLALTQPLDVALVDIQMPGVDGWTTARGLRARLGEEPFLVALTAQTTADDPTLLHSAGFDGFAAKPLKLAALQTLLIQASNHKQLQTNRPRGIFDRTRWAEMSGITTESGASLLDVMCARVTSTLPEVKRRIEEASQKRQQSDLRRALHEANGLLSLIGATAARALADDYERRAERGLLDEQELSPLLEAITVVLGELHARHRVN